MTLEGKQLYLCGGLRPKIEPCLNMLENWVGNMTDKLQIVFRNDGSHLL